MKKLFISAVFVFLVLAGQAQEMQARFSVMANRVSSQVYRKVFQTLQTAMTNFINNRKWTNGTYQAQEKIKCNFLLTIEQDLGQNVYKASLTVQAARPAYNTSYESPIVNFQDPEVTFKYVEFQPIEFNENRVQGNDPLVANLPAVMAYYVYLILGMDHGSFAPKGGDAYFQKAQTIVNNAPENSQISGWKPFDGLRNRFRLIEGFTDVRFNLIHDAIYTYYRQGLDQFYENELNGQTGIFNALSFFNTVNIENPGSMVIQFFFQGKSSELVKVFSRAQPQVKTQAKELLSKLDVTNAKLYKEL